MMKLFVKFWRYLPRLNKAQFILLVILAFFASMSEIVSIGAIIPFLTALINPERLIGNHFLMQFISFYGLDINQKYFLITFTYIFIFCVILSALIRVGLIWAVTRFGHNLGAKVGADMYWQTLHMPYATHLENSSGEFISMITNKSSIVIYSIVIPLITFISSFFIIFGLLFSLFYFDAVVGLQLLFCFAIAYFFLLLATRRGITIQSKNISKDSTRLIKLLQDGLGGIRDITMDGTQNIFHEAFVKSDRRLRYSQANVQIFTQTPRYLVESIFIVSVAFIALNLSSEAGFLDSIPIMGALALAAQRVLPLLQQLYASYMTMKGGKDSFKEVVLFLEKNSIDVLNLLDSATLNFDVSIKLVNVSFRYGDNLPWVLKGVNLEIKKGQCIGIIGPTGGGKTTLLDIVMGLLLPTSGDIEIDGIKIDSSKSMKLWRKNVAHVPQTIFLADSDIKGNIAFGVESSDEEKIIDAATNAQIHEEITRMKDGYLTQVGERGIRLSGGQLQRIAIARALYKTRIMIVLDEATSALDEGTERKVINAIHHLPEKPTIIMVAHRTTTLSECDAVYEVKNNIISKVR
jgi:ATP-binding cassette subfamily B protein